MGPPSDKDLLDKYISSTKKLNTVTRYFSSQTNSESSSVAADAEVSQTDEIIFVPQSKDCQTQTTTIQESYIKEEHYLELIKKLEGSFSIEQKKAATAIAENQKMSFQIQSIKAENNKSHQIVEATKSNDIFWNLINNFDNMSDIQKGIISSIIQKPNQYDEGSKVFWKDMFLNMSHRQFNKLAESLNGPWRCTIRRWLGNNKFTGFDLMFCNVASFSEEVYGKPQFYPPVTPYHENYQWSSGSAEKIGDVELYTCMIDETATKIIVQYNPKDDKLYGFSAMPRFVIIRSVEEDFDVKEFFAEFELQYDKRIKREVCGTANINIAGKSYIIAYAQFSNYNDWNSAINMECDYKIDIIESLPCVDGSNAQKSIDLTFAESEGIGRPRSTYVYSLALSSLTREQPLKEIASISTNNRFLQNVDHKFLTYNLMKMLNMVKVPILQFVAARFRNQMMTMSSYVPYPNADHCFNERMLHDMSQQIYDEGIEAGWILPDLSPFNTFHFIVKENEVGRPDTSEHLPNNASEPFFADETTKVSFYLTLRCAADVFQASAPIIGGLPRVATQDQCHWLRKVIKSSMLSCKPLRLGNYLVLFSHINKVYQMGPSHGLVRRDVDVSNKTDQRSAERLISRCVLNGVSMCEWSLGTSFYLNMAKKGLRLGGIQICHPWCVSLIATMS